MAPETMPGRAVRSTILVIVRCLVTPRAKEASRKSFGTIFSISSLDLTTVGNISRERATEPSKPLMVPGPSRIVNIEKANRPATMDGMPLITSTSRETVVASLPRFEYSTRYTAHIKPIGMEITIAPAVISRVPMMACSTPP